jgi:hypothetical protein
MNSVLQDIRSGWKEMNWISTFALVGLPATVLVFVLASLISGKPVDVSSPIAWVLGLPVLLAALWWAGIKDGPRGYLGASVWRVTCAALCAYVVLRTLSSRPAGVQRWNFWIAGNGMSVIVTPRPRSTPEKKVSPRILEYIMSGPFPQMDVQKDWLAKV